MKNKRGRSKKEVMALSQIILLVIGIIAIAYAVGSGCGGTMVQDGVISVFAPGSYWEKKEEEKEREREQKEKEIELLELQIEQMKKNQQ